MVVRYIGNTIQDEFLVKLVKNGIYNATSCDVSRNSISIEGISSEQSLSYFENVDGTEIRYVDYSPEIEHVSEWGYKSLQEGDLLLCIAKSLKTLTYGKIYTLEADVTSDDWEIPLLEYKGKRRYGRHNFKKFSKEYIRTMKIDDLLEEGDLVNKDRFVHDDKPVISREEKNILLFQLMLKAKNHIDYVGVKNISLLDIIKEMNHPLVDSNDLSNFENIDFKELLNRK